MSVMSEHKWRNIGIGVSCIYYQCQTCGLYKCSFPGKEAMYSVNDESYMFMPDPTCDGVRMDDALS